MDMMEVYHVVSIIINSVSHNNDREQAFSKCRLLSVVLLLALFFKKTFFISCILLSSYYMHSLLFHESLIKVKMIIGLGMLRGFIFGNRITYPYLLLVSIIAPF
jgi:hypothetical protein